MNETERLTRMNELLLKYVSDKELIIGKLCDTLEFVKPLLPHSVNLKLDTIIFESKRVTLTDKSNKQSCQQTI